MTPLPSWQEPRSHAWMRLRASSCATRSGARTQPRRARVRAWRDLPSLRDPERFDAWLQPPARPRLHGRGAEASSTHTRGPSSTPIDHPTPIWGRCHLRRRARCAPRTRLQATRTRATCPDRPASLPWLAAAGGGRDHADPAGTPQPRLNRALSSPRAALEADARITSEIVEVRSALTTRDGFTRLLDTWLAEEGAPTAPDYLDDVLVRTTGTRQRPAWISPGQAAAHGHDTQSSRLQSPRSRRPSATPCWPCSSSRSSSPGSRSTRDRSGTACRRRSDLQRTDGSTSTSTAPSWRPTRTAPGGRRSTSASRHRPRT